MGCTSDGMRFHPGLRPNRSNTMPSTQYWRRLQKLTSATRTQLARLLDELFARSDGSLDYSESLPRPRMRFRCQYGTIHYFWSRKLRKFVLLDFACDDDSNGGLFQRACARTPTSCTPHQRRVASADGRIAASRVVYAVKVARAGFDGRRTMVLRQAPVWSVSKLIVSPFSDPFVTRALLRKMRMVARFGSRIESAAPLPGWSLLGRFVVVPEQLANGYASSILAGEAMCGLGNAIRLLPGLNRRGTIEPTVIAFRESLDHCDRLPLIWETLDNVADVGERGAAALDLDRLVSANCNFLVADGDLTNAWLQVARAEVTLRLATSVIENARGLLVSLRDRPRSVDASDADLQVLRKFALLSDFVRLSESFFEPALGRRRFWPELEVDGLARGGASNADFLRCAAKLYSFGSAASVLVEFIAGSREEPEDDGDRRRLHARLAGIVAEILDSPSR